MTRSEQRQQIFALVFEKMFHDENISDIIELAIESREIKPNNFVNESFNGVFENIDKIDKIIEEHSIGWKLSRISKVALSIMRVAIYEMLFVDNIPISVSINEAVELAKTYGGDEDPSYINGVLGSVAKAIEK